MASQVDIINLALHKLGQSVKIAAISDRSKAAAVFGGLWDAMLDEVLAARNWAWAITSEAAAPSADAAALGWTYRYAVPNDCVTVVAVTDESGLRYNRRLSRFCDPNFLTANWGRVAFDFELSYGSTETTLNSDVPGAYVIYVRRITDTGRYPPVFVNALAWRLAAEAAPPIIGDQGLRAQASMLNGYENALAQAGEHDKAQSRDTQDDMPSAVAARA